MERHPMMHITSLGSLLRPLRRRTGICGLAHRLRDGPFWLMHSPSLGRHGHGDDAPLVTSTRSAAVLCRVLCK